MQEMPNVFFPDCDLIAEEQKYDMCIECYRYEICKKAWEQGNKKFPYRIEKAHWYLMFLWRINILTDDEFERAIERLNKKTGSSW